jgi:hypothetical protein
LLVIVFAWPEPAPPSDHGLSVRPEPDRSLIPKIAILHGVASRRQDGE